MRRCLVTTVSASSDRHDLDVMLRGAEQLPTGTAALEFLRNIVTALARGADVSVLGEDKQITPNEAAKLIGISHPHLLTFMNAGALAFTRVGTHRRIKVSDLLDFNARRQGARQVIGEARTRGASAEARWVDRAAFVSVEALDELDSL